MQEISNLIDLFKQGAIDKDMLLSQIKGQEVKENSFDLPRLYTARSIMQSV
jgi:hypothetical protein